MREAAEEAADGEDLALQIGTMIETPRAALAAAEIAQHEDLEIGICGEHGADPPSVAFCHELGLDYVSCSPFRLPVARLAAAHARGGLVAKPTARASFSSRCCAGRAGLDAFRPAVEAAGPEEASTSMSPRLWRRGWAWS